MASRHNQTYQKISRRRIDIAQVCHALLRLLLLGCLLPFAAAQASQNLSGTAEQAIAKVYDAIQKKQWPQLKTLLLQAAPDPLLGGYPHYWQLREQLRKQIRDGQTTVPEATLQRFIEQHHEDAYLVDRLKAEWLVAAAQQGNWHKVQALEPVLHNNAAITCARLLARHKTGATVKSQNVLQALADHDLCWAMLETLVQDKVVSRDALHTLLRDLLEANRTTWARRVAALLFNARQMRDYTALMKNPRQWLNNNKPSSNRAQRALTTLALARLARSSNARSDARSRNANYFEKQWARHLPQADRLWVWGQFALAAVLNGEPQAADWYRRSGTARKTEYNHAWQVRAQLRQPVIDWTQVNAAIVQMPAAQQQQTAWQYWRARAQAALQQTRAAQDLYTQVAAHDDFYGLLAREELGLPLALPAPAAAITPQDMAFVRSHTGLQRAIRLFQLDLRQEAVPAWNFALRGMTDRQLRAAAALAFEAQVYDRVITTALRATTENDVAQRFIAPHTEHIHPTARQLGVEVAWVYGLIRQESRFIDNVYSSAGAAGLMQLMPATAKWVATKIGLKSFRPAHITDIKTNTLLGTHYLNMVRDDFDGSQILATAGYNAGPKRAKQWQGRLSTPLEGAVFVETIPFTETRLYVKNVLANTVHYALAFGAAPQSLKARLGVVAPVGAFASISTPATDLP